MYGGGGGILKTVGEIKETNADDTREAHTKTQKQTQTKTQVQTPKQTVQKCYQKITCPETRWKYLKIKTKKKHDDKRGNNAKKEKVKYLGDTKIYRKSKKVVWKSWKIKSMKRVKN